MSIDDFLKRKGFNSFEDLKKDLKSVQSENRAWEKLNAPIWKLNDKGILFEKSGKLEKAIVEYEKCLKYMLDNYPQIEIAWHSPNRLRILYKKVKHPNEKQFLIEFINFCRANDIQYPELFDKQLSKL